MKDIVLVGISPLVERRANVFYINELIAKGFRFTHCDLSPCFFENLNYENVISADYALTFSNLQSFEDYLCQLNIENTIFIVEIFHSTKYKEVFKVIKRHNCFCVKMNPNASDFTYYHIPLIKKVQLWGIRKVLTEQAVSLRGYYKKIYGRSCYNIYSTLISSGNDPKIGIHINQQDWEKSQELEALKPIVNYKYAVFCDEFFPDHPDYMYFGGFENINDIQKKYREEINSFFDILERKHHVKIVVAAHPKSNYKGDEFNGRDIIKGKTMELVKNASFTIVHGSMSISYSIIFNIPIVLAITDDMLKVAFCKRQSFIYSDYFELPVCNISHQYVANPKLVSPSIREKYIYDYMTSPGIEDKKNADVLAEAFSKM